MTLSPQALEQNQEFIDQIRELRARNPKANEFFRQFLEFCQDYENQHHADLNDNSAYWLYRLGRMLSLIGEDPFPNLTFTHPDGNPPSAQGYAG